MNFLLKSSQNFFSYYLFFYLCVHLLKVSPTFKTRMPCLTNGKLLIFQIELLEKYDNVYLNLEKIDVIITYIKTLMNI